MIEVGPLQSSEINYACYRDNWNEYEEAYNKFKTARWFPDPYVGPPAKKDRKAFDFWKCGEEPGRPWEHYQGPVLLIFGEI